MRRDWAPVAAGIVCSLVAGVAVGEGPAATAPAPEMTTYQLVLLSRVAIPAPMGERQIQAMQEQRLDYVADLARRGKLLIEGHVSRAGRLANVLVLDVPDTDAARAILADDPWVQAGRYEFEIHAWWAAGGVLSAPVDPRDQEWCFLGLLKRPANAPDLPDEKLMELQRGHLDNIERMADEGELVMAGPLGDDGELRGILIFRESTAERIRELVARDPAIRAGRLSLELFPWRVPRGVLPAR